MVLKKVSAIRYEIEKVNKMLGAILYNKAYLFAYRDALMFTLGEKEELEDYDPDPVGKTNISGDNNEERN